MPLSVKTQQIPHSRLREQTKDTYYIIQESTATRTDLCATNRYVACRGSGLPH
jgi:hypothetical protein